MVGVVIIGAGQAGLQLASSLREQGYSGEVQLIGEEPWAPYQRPPLSKAFLAGAVSEPQLFMQEPTYFEEHHVEFLANEVAVAVHRDLKQVDLASGKFIQYDHLVFATGARNRTLPCAEGAMSGVLSLRTLDDARHLREAVDAARTMVVIGAGFLGLEAATIAAAAGANVQVVEAGARVLGRVVSAPLSDVVRRSHEEAGVTFHFSQAVVAIHGVNGHVRSVELQSGERLEADLVLISIGVVPNDELAAACGLAVHNGIVVDKALMTEDPAVSAIGDCAVFPYAFDLDRPVRLESVQNAVDQARCVAGRIVNKGDDYDRVPVFWSDQAGLRLQIAGLTSGGETVVIRGDVEGKAFSAFCFKDDRLVAVESVNRLPDHMLARRLLGAHIRPTREQISDLDFDIKALFAQTA